jgi:uncharacterized membrane protein
VSGVTEASGPKRSISRKFRKQLETEIEAWKQQGQITPEQAESILSQYVVVSPLYGRLIVILVTLGAILAGVGVIIFVSANWQAIPRFGKEIMLIALVVVTYFAGYWLKYEKDFPRAGAAILFVGSMVYGATIFLIGQQYHVPLDDPMLLTWWFIGVIPAAYFTRSKAILTLAILAALYGLGYKTSNWLDNVKGLYNTEYAFFAFYLLLGVILYTIGAVHSRFERVKLFTQRYQVFGLILLLGVVYVLSFHGLYSQPSLEEWSYARLPFGFQITFHIIAALAFICALWSAIIDARRKQISGRLSGDLAGIIVGVVLSYIALCLPFHSLAIYMIVFNIVLFGGVLGLIFLGYFRGAGYLVNIALVFFGLAVIGRYFDAAWNLLPRSIFFIVGGILLIGVGLLLESLRRKTLQRMRAVEVADETET